MVLGVFITIFTSGVVLKNLSLLVRCVILAVLSLLACVVFAIVFEWIPLHLWQAWLSFAGTFLGFFIISFGCMIIKTKLDDKKYNQLLSSYKTKNLTTPTSHVTITKNKKEYQDNDNDEKHH